MKKTIHNKARRRPSITLQMSLVFASILAISFLACVVINNLFLEKYYINNKEKTLNKIYMSICEASDNGTLESDEFGLKLQQFSSNYNSSIIVITSLFEPIKIYSVEPADHLIGELRNNIWGWNKPSDILYKGDDFVLTRQYDYAMASEYIEMWGSIPGGGFFMMRTALQSIHESVAIANRFLLLVAVGAVVVSTFIAYFFAKKLSKPILELADISSQMAEMDFEARYGGKATWEIETLGKNINYLSETLEEKISELKEANAELEHDLELKEKINEKGKEFISNVSHELKTPIALIQGYAEGLQEVADEAEERDYYCDVIIDEASKMNKMVRELLRLSEIEIGNTGLSIARFDIITLVENFIQSYEIMTKQNDIMVSVSEKNPIYVWADEFMIEEVFMNYFTNALNHCQAQGQKRIEISFERIGDSVKVNVFNTGENIPEEYKDDIWEKFYKIDKARTREYGGSGVGLSIVKAIMDYHGQKCGVTNVDGGVVFWFTLDTKE